MSVIPPSAHRFMDDRVRALVDHLETLPSEDRTRSALAAAAVILEFSAYELAKSEEAKRVARLILLAADLERTALQLGELARQT